MKAVKLHEVLNDYIRVRKELKPSTIINYTQVIGYIVADVERLRKPMQLITDYILKCMELRNSAEVINFNP